MKKKKEVEDIQQVKIWMTEKVVYVQLAKKKLPPLFTV